MPSKAAQQAWKKAHQERHRELNRRYRERHLDDVKARDAAYRVAHADAIRARRYGLTAEVVDAKFEAQGRRCACCGSPDPRGKGWHIDHDHKTGEFRGVLCSPCNTGIGLLGDSVVGVSNAIPYLDPSAPRVDEHW